MAVAGHGAAKTLEKLFGIHDHLFRVQTDVAYLSAEAGAAVAARKAETQDEVLPWTPTVQALNTLSSRLAEHQAVVGDALTALRSVRHTLREEENQPWRLAGASAGEVRAALDEQDSRRSRADVVEELLAVCASLSVQLEEVDKEILTALTY